MIISVFNLSNGAISDREMQRVIRAINIQIGRDFEPYWSFAATLRLEGHSGSTARRRPYDLQDMRGDALLCVWDKSASDADGEHILGARGVPVGFVYLDLSEKLAEDWSVTLSHEALELLGDPQNNLTVQGSHPDPKEEGRDVFHWFEMCDAVQAQTYSIDKVTVSDFVLPLYFTSGGERGSRNNFLGAASDCKGRARSGLKSFGVLPGGYIGFFDPKQQRHVTYDADDRSAKMRSAIKKGKRGRRTQRAGRANFGLNK